MRSSCGQEQPQEGGSCQVSNTEEPEATPTVHDQGTMEEGKK
jgi:hypothetical protein